MWFGTCPLGTNIFTLDIKTHIFLVRSQWKFGAFWRGSKTTVGVEEGACLFSSSTDFSHFCYNTSFTWREESDVVDARNDETKQQWEGSLIPAWNGRSWLVHAVWMSGTRLEFREGIQINVPLSSHRMTANLRFHGHAHEQVLKSASSSSSSSPRDT